ncbi:hypothetical protein ACWEKJ_18465 [Amycolatopsis thermoflava]
MLDPARLCDLVLRPDSVPYQRYARSVGALALPDLSVVAAMFATTTTMHAWFATCSRPNSRGGSCEPRPGTR